MLARVMALEGAWVGTNKLWLDPSQPARESDATLTLRPAGQGLFVTMAYTWADEGRPQDGLLVMGFDASRQKVTAFWLDSWHMRDAVMVCEGEGRPDGSVEVAGSYAAPPGPDWGWILTIEPGDESFRFLMYNVSPEGQKDLAVEAVFERALH